MEEEIANLLSINSNLKAKIIARKLGLTKKAVSSFLHANANFSQNSEYEWHQAKPTKTLILPNKWVTSTVFENSLESCGCPSSAPETCFTVELPKDCKLMLDAGIKLLTLLNQLVSIGKSATIDFTECKPTKNYLNRAGFFDALDPSVKVLPSRPKQSTATVYRKNSLALFELAFIDPENPNNTVPRELADIVKSWASNDVFGPVYTIFSELFDNVCDHSKTKTPGIAGSQVYKGRQHRIQTIISDSGVGICRDLRKALEEDPDKKQHAKLSDTDLIIMTLTEGGLSRYGPDENDGHGLGLKLSGVSAIKLHATVAIRQKDFYLILRYKNGQFEIIRERKSIPLIEGTHICFEFHIE